jgi:hypothetical protein
MIALLNPSGCSAYDQKMGKALIPRVEREGERLTRSSWVEPIFLGHGRLVDASFGAADESLRVQSNRYPRGFDYTPSRRCSRLPFPETDRGW